MNATYESIEAQEDFASEDITVEMAKYAEEHGAPFPVSGDLTARHVYLQKHVSDHNKALLAGLERLMVDVMADMGPGLFQEDTTAVMVQIEQDERGE